MIGGGVEGICGKCTPSFKNVKFLLESCWGEEHAEVWFTNAVFIRFVGVKGGCLCNCGGREP